MKKIQLISKMEKIKEGTKSRLTSELKNFNNPKKSKHKNILTLIPDNGNLLQWTSTFRGPQKTPYERGIFELEIKFPCDYPFKPPIIKFAKKEVYHGNIDEHGSFNLIETLSNSNQTKRFLKYCY